MTAMPLGPPALTSPPATNLGDSAGCETCFNSATHRVRIGGSTLIDFCTNCYNPRSQFIEASHLTVERI